MSQADWEVEQTEAGLQQVLQKLQECRAAGDLVETGYGLLALSYLVKWVRSDTNSPPFVRSQELALEALKTFRQTSDKIGLLNSLIVASAMTDPTTRETYLTEAESIALELGDENKLAAVIAARARGLALSDRKAAAVLHHRALEIYRRTGNTTHQAQCLFALSITDDSAEERHDYALEAAQLFRSVKDPAMAAKCVQLALMNAREFTPLGDLEDLAKQGLQDALAAGERGFPWTMYRQLSAIAAAKGNLEEMHQYRQLADEAEAMDGLTPFERWQLDVELTKQMIKTAKDQGDTEMVTEFKKMLKELKSDRPKKK
ncbi:MAG TPA: hypothetical protein VK171_03135 [Fimbriimonas sp.]|nr:hypothetical protein [Fimbriimonas sp.]